jgi:hypothetical protein
LPGAAYGEGDDGRRPFPGARQGVRSLTHLERSPCSGDDVHLGCVLGNLDGTIPSDLVLRPNASLELRPRFTASLPSAPARTNKPSTPVGCTVATLDHSVKAWSRDVQVDHTHTTVVLLEEDGGGSSALHVQRPVSMWPCRAHLRFVNHSNSSAAVARRSEPLIRVACATASKTNETKRTRGKRLCDDLTRLSSVRHYSTLHASVVRRPP